MPTKDNQDLIKSYLKLVNDATDKLAATSQALNMAPEDFVRQSYALCVDMLSQSSPDYEVSPYWAKRKFELEMNYPELFTQTSSHTNSSTDTKE